MPALATSKPLFRITLFTIVIAALATGCNHRPDEWLAELDGICATYGPPDAMQVEVLPDGNLHITTTGDQQALAVTQDDGWNTLEFFVTPANPDGPLSPALPQQMVWHWPGPMLTDFDTSGFPGDMIPNHPPFSPVYSPDAVVEIPAGAEFDVIISAEWFADDRGGGWNTGCDLAVGSFVMP